MTTRHDSVPLMQSGEDPYDESNDVRFAIDDEDEEGQQSGAVGGAPEERLQSMPRSNEQNGGQYQSVSQHAADEDEDAGYKYPPAAPPPSYREATGRSAVLHYMRTLGDHLGAPEFSSLKSFLHRILGRAWMFICRFWPTSRFAQLGLFMAGLWLLVILSGPAFEDAGDHAGAGYPWAGLDNLSEQGPPPISGDGHVISNANWTLRSCQNSKAHHGEVLCTSTTRIELKAPTNFASSEDLFIFADPPRRDHLSDGRGHTPGTIEVKLVDEGTDPNQSPKGKVSVVIDAHYEQSRGEVFERTTIAKLGARIASEGVGIYSYPLPSRYKKRYPPPLYMSIKVLIPVGTVIGALRIETSSMTIGAFTDPEPMHAPQRKRSRTVGNGKELSARAPVPRTQGAPPFFGRFNMVTATSSIRAGDSVPLLAAGMVKMQSYNGEISVASEIKSTEVRFESMTGNVRLEKSARVTAFREAHVRTQTGNIALEPHSLLKASVATASTRAGSILGGNVADAGIWASNHTLDLKSTTGKIDAAVAVQNVTLLGWNPHNTVHVNIGSETGSVGMHFIEIQNGPSLQASITSKLGSTTAHLGKAYEGQWLLEGSSKSELIEPAADDTRKFIKSEHSELDHLKQPKTVLQKGEIGSVTHALDMDKKPAPESSVSVRSSLGVAKLTFD